MAYITGSVSDIIGTLPFSLAANSQLTMSIQNNGDAPSYWGLETIPDNNGFYTSTTPKNLSGSFISGSGISNVVYDDYKMSAVVNPGGGTLIFNNAVAISASTLWTRATAPSPLPGDFPYALANGYSARVSRSNGVTEASSAIVSSIQTLPMLQNASFLYIPSGYASGSAFSQLSTNDYGDLSFTRASSATRTLSGSIIDSARTNFIRNSSMVDAVAGSPGTLPTNWVSQSTAGLTLEVASTGIENGLDYIDIRYSGTATSTTIRLFFEASNQIVATNGQTWTTSFYTSISGSALPSNYRLGVATNTSAGFSVSSIVATPNIPQTTTLTRYNRVVTLPGGATVARAQPGIYVTLVSGQTYDFTIRIAAPQLELGLQVTDWISTTNSARTTFAGITQDGTTDGNISRLDYSYGSDPALLLEPQRTNTIFNSTMMSASVAGNILPSRWVFTSNGITSSVVGLGYENNLPYIDLRTFGTASSTFTQYILGNDADTPTTSGSRQTFSTWVKVISSSLPPTSTQLLVNEISSSNAYIRSNTLNIDPTSTLQRFIFTSSISAPTTSFATPCVFFGTTNGQRYDFTTRIAAPQLESGSFATTWIPTYLNSATRVADSFSRNNIFTNGLITSAGGTWFVELRGNVVMTRDTSEVGLFIGNSSNGLTGDCLLIRNNGSNTRIVINKRIAGTQTSIYTTTTDTTKIAIKWNGTNADVFVNGTKVVSATAFATTNMEFFNGSGADVTKFIQQMALFSTPLSDAECISLTTL